MSSINQEGSTQYNQSLEESEINLVNEPDRVNETEINRAAWDQRTALHLKSEFYDLESFRAGRCSLNSIELETLPEVEGKSLVHLQCHFGQDTLSWARRGAQVTGVDFSPEAIKAARELASDLRIEARFLESDVLKLELDEQFDIVFTSYGVLTWLPDLQRWAETVASLLRPGGYFVMVEFHPALMMLDFDTATLSYDYFRKPYREEVAGSYAARDPGSTHVEHFWTHSLDEVLTPLLSEGLTLLEFREFDYSPYGCFPNMVEQSPGIWRWRSKIRLPHLFSLKMTRP